MLGCGSGSGANQVATLDCIFPLFANLIYWLLLFSGTVSIVMIILSGIRLIVSGGEAKTVETAKKSMTYAILGLLLVFLSFMILNAIAYVTGVACLKDILKEGFGFTSCQ
jgi:predicted small integral membrane protein